MDIQYHGLMDELTRSQWIAERLGERWRNLPDAGLEATAVSRDQKLREPPPDEAISRWLSPVGDH
jgi:hypothetical protein